MRRFGIAAGVIALCVASPALSEKLHVSSIYPAHNDSAVALRSIAVEQFGGEFGPDLSIRVEDVLRAANLRGRPWFRVVPNASGNQVDAVMRGSADAEQKISFYTEDRERCIKDASGNCTSAKEKYTVACKRRHVDLVVRMRLVATDGRLVWSDDNPASSDDSWCEDTQSTSRSLSAVARGLTGSVASRMQIDFVPYPIEEDIRVDENRKGLAGGDAEKFKAAVGKVKHNDVRGACADWQTLAEANPAHAPTLYNLGLCAESLGDDVTAGQFYHKATGLDPKHDKALAGLDRIALRERARRQIEAHGGN